MGLEWSRTGPPCGSNEPDTRFAIVSKVHYLHFAMIDFAVVAVVLVVVSILTKPQSEGKVSFVQCRHLANTTVLILSIQKNLELET